MCLPVKSQTKGQKTGKFGQDDSLKLENGAARKDRERKMSALLSEEERRNASQVARDGSEHTQGLGTSPRDQEEAPIRKRPRGRAHRFSPVRE